jgi:hypothetical protein
MESATYLLITSKKVEMEGVKGLVCWKKPEKIHRKSFSECPQTRLPAPAPSDLLKEKA